jgi:hypothetical protein
VLWQYVIIVDIMALRVTLFFYCVCDSLARTALFLIYAIEMPIMVAATILGQFYYSNLKFNLDCVSVSPLDFQIQN